VCYKIKMESKELPGILNRYHPVVNFVFRPIYKSLGGKYNPFVAENVTGLASFVFHTGFFSAIDGGIGAYISEGDLKKTISAAGISLLFPVGHFLMSLGKQSQLIIEKKEFKYMLISDGHTENVDSLVEVEFKRRRAEYAKTPKFYTGFEPRDTLDV